MAGWWLRTDSLLWVSMGFQEAIMIARVVGLHFKVHGGPTCRPYLRGVVWPMLRSLGWRVMDVSKQAWPCAPIARPVPCRSLVDSPGILNAFEHAGCESP